jgi:hypothetical protein
MQTFTWRFRYKADGMDNINDIASICTATSRVVQIANAINIP